MSVGIAMSESAHASRHGRNDQGTREQHRSGGDQRGTAPPLLTLQHLAGNAAVSALLTRRPAAHVQRAPTGVQDFVDQWMKDHLTIGNKEFAIIAGLPADQRTAVLAEVRRRYGDEYIRRGQDGQLPVGAQPSPPAAEPVNAEDYWTKHAAAHLDAALNQVMTSVDVDISGPGLRFDQADRSAFVHLALVAPLQRRDPGAVSQLLDTPLHQLIDNARVLDDLDKGSPVYQTAITTHIVERLGLGLRRATVKLGPTYALARAKSIADARAATSPFPIPGTVVDSDPNSLLAVQPTSGSFGATTTMEYAVADALTTGTLVTFDESAFGMLYVPQASPEPRPTVLELERGTGDWKSVRVTSPADARPVDVANALFGTPELAHLVVGHESRYAFSFPPSGRLAEPYDEWWHKHIEEDEGGDVLDLIRGRAPSDPLAGLDGQDAELRALSTAGAPLAEDDQAVVVQRLGIIHEHLLAIDTAATALGVAGLVKPAVNRISARLEACVADPAEAQKWSAHTAEQLSVITEARTGFDAITQQLLASGASGRSTEVGEELVGDATKAMQGPTIELTQAFATVVAASDQLDIAGSRLTVARERLALYPFDMADRLLATIRERIAVTSDYATIAWQSYGRARLDALQAEISADVAQLRLAVINGDGTAVTRLADLKTKMAMLDLQSTVGSTMSVIDELKGALPASESWAPDKERQAEIHDALQEAIVPWRDLGADYEKLWRSGEDRDEAQIAAIRARVEQLRKTTPLPRLVAEVTSFQTDEAKRQRWIAIGVMIAAALAAAITGGLASGAIGGFAGAIVGAGMEALTFTAITGTLNTDQTFGGFMAELTVNWATFGGLRGISKGAQVLAGGGTLTVAQKIAELSVEGLWMVAATKANEEIQAAINRGQKMTTQTAANIFGHQMLISLASRIVARGATKILNGRADHLPETQRFLTSQQEATKLAQGFLAKGDDAAGAAIVQAETASLKAEMTARQRIHEIASDPAKAKQHDLELTAAELTDFAAGTRARARELTEREIALLMEKTETHGTHIVAEPTVFTELLKHHRDLGSRVTESLDAAGSPQARVTPQLADGSFGSPFTVHSRLDEDVRRILNRKGLSTTAGVHDYVAARAGDRAAALADLRRVGSAAELEALIDTTLGVRPAPVAGPRAPRAAEDRAARQARVEAQQKATAEKNRLTKLQHPDWPVVGDKPVRPWKATATEYKWKYNDGNFIEAKFANGTLSVKVVAHGPRRVGAAKLLDAVFDHFGHDQIKRFAALWVGGGGFADNYNRYMRNLANHMSPRDAALNTWTGEQMIRLKLPNVTVPAHAPNAKEVTPVFSR